ncbi:MAG TPA: hypothetical protein VML50_10535 [Anaeromyxobacter sp.]|nr:hypothetical protein [Anaeromyxobacter sp.]
MQFKRIVRQALIAAVVLSGWASAQVPFPPNWAGAPTGSAKQSVYPYDGQCWASIPIAGLPQCQVSSSSAAGYAASFLCDGAGFPNQTAGGWGKCGAVQPAPAYPFALLTGDTQRANKYRWEVLNPLDYTPDTAKYPGADYYEIGLHEAWGFQAIASAGLFPDPTKVGGTAVPNGMQWTGLTDPGTGKPLPTPIWGVGQINKGGGPVTTTLQSLGLFPTGTPAKVPSWSSDSYVATWPSINIRGTTGRPVVVKWINEFPNNHLFCPHPEAADWPCAIDRTFMGVKASIDPQKAPPTLQKTPLTYAGVNQYGSPQQPDNSWVTHLHGGEIPPQTDGFAEKWFGNRVTGQVYSPQPWPLDPAFFAPAGSLVTQQIGLSYSNIFRPGGDPSASAFTSWYYDTYAYPMVNQESTIWFHDHTLGKTHHNVIAGPAGFFPVKDPSKHYPVVRGKCTGPRSDSCEYTWIDAVTEPRDSLGVPMYDLFLAVQDRDFNADGTINFPNGLGQAPSATPVSPAGYPAVAGNTPFTPGPNPQVHPVWVPEYFNSNALVNGVLWPKKTVEPGFYRIRFVDGSDARCYNFTFSTQDPWASAVTDPITGQPAPVRPAASIPFTLVANEQGYLPRPLKVSNVTMCPGERYELIFDFRKYAAGTRIYLVNDAPAPYPGGGNGPFDPGSPFPDMATIMRFDVGAATTTTVASLAIPAVIDQDFDDLTGNSGGTPLAPCGPGVDPTRTRCIAAVRNLYLNERIDGITGASLGLQINGVPFEYDVTETPKRGTYELWNIVNLTVDAHPIHPHLVKAQVLSRQDLDVQGYRLALCQSDAGSNDCTPGMSPGSVIQLIPDPTPFLLNAPVKPDPTEVGWKDAMRAMPGQVTSFIARWDGSWRQSTAAGGADVTAPGAGNPNCMASNACSVSVGAGGTSVSCSSGAANLSMCGKGSASSWVFPAVTSGPYVWHCHINSHEDSEMMRTSLVVK